MEKQYVEDLIRQLVDYRKEQNLSQEGFAKKVDYKQSAISRLEKCGNTPRLDTFIYLANMLGLKVVLVKEER